MFAVQIPIVSWMTKTQLHPCLMISWCIWQSAHHNLEAMMLMDLPKPSQEKSYLQIVLGHQL